LIISLFPVFAVTALAETDFMGGKATMNGEADVSVRGKDVDGSKEKFNEYRESPTAHREAETAKAHRG